MNDQAVTWDELRPALAEAAGGRVLEELVLDRMLDREMASTGIKVSREAVERERALLMESLTRDTRADANDAQRLLDNLRRTRALGDTRFEAQLARTAKLRALVARTVAVSDDDVRIAHEMRHGRAFITRVIVLPGEREAAKVWSELGAGDKASLAVRFAEAAVKHSKDPSASRGGLLGPVSPDDPTFPTAMRELLPTTEPGAMSPIFALDRGYAFILVEERHDGDGVTFEQSAAALRDELTRRRERLAMDELARGLLTQAKVGVIDPGLRWSWEGRRR